MGNRNPNPILKDIIALSNINKRLKSRIAEFRNKIKELESCGTPVKFIIDEVAVGEYELLTICAINLYGIDGYEGKWIINILLNDANSYTLVRCDDKKYAFLYQTKFPITKHTCNYGDDEGAGYVLFPSAKSCFMFWNFMHTISDMPLIYNDTLHRWITKI
jgi:hypothetical protein